MAEIDVIEKRQGLHLASFRYGGIENKGNSLVEWPKMRANCERQANLPGIGITPGTIQAGVTHSANVDPARPAVGSTLMQGVGYVGGSVDTPIDDTPRPITVTFDGPVRAFGFDTNALGSSSKNIVINFAPGLPFIANLAIGGEYNNPALFGAAFDHFRCTAVDASGILEPATFTLAASALAAAAVEGIRQARRA